MAEIQIAIEGEGAVPAGEALLEIPGLSGTLDTESRKDGGATATVATIIGIVGGTIAIAEQIRKWYQEYKQSRLGKQFDVVIVAPDGQRVWLESATVEEICQVLKALDQQHGKALRQSDAD